MKQQPPKLSEFDARIKGGILIFDCPTCTPLGNAHGVRVPLFPTTNQDGLSWTWEGELENLTLTGNIHNTLSSVDAGCWHGHIIKGEVRTCGVEYLES